MEGALTAEFEIKPALLAGRRTFEIGDGTVLCRSKDGAVDWKVDLAQVEHAAFVEHNIRGALMWRFDLVAGGERRSISLTMSAGAAGLDPDRPVFLDLVEALCTALEAAQPGFQAGIGEYGKYRMMWFGLGVLSVLFGGGILVAALISGISADRLVAAGIWLGFLILLGLVLIRGYHPWQKPPLVPVTTLGQIVRAWSEK